MDEMTLMRLSDQAANLMIKLDSTHPFGPYHAIRLAKLSRIARYRYHRRLRAWRNNGHGMCEWGGVGLW